MDKRKQNIFTGDIEIPGIVQQKADFAFSQIRKEKVAKMNKNVIEMEQEEKQSNNSKRRTAWRKIIPAVAACAVIATAVGVGNFYQSNSQPVVELADNGEDSNLTNTNPFVLMVHAAESGEKRELENGIPVAIDVNASGWVLGASEDGTTAYCINLPFSCEGENIESITYSINKGAFQVVENADASIIIAGTELSEGLNAGQIGGDYDEENGGVPSYPVSVKYYSDITLAYDEQNSDTTWINMCNDEIKLSDKDLLWGDNPSGENLKKGYEELIGGVVITCTVNFKDKTTQSTDLEVGTVLTTAKEAGFDYEVGSDEEVVLFTFERK